jgi:hypothetical protein
MLHCTAWYFLLQYINMMHVKRERYGFVGNFGVEWLDWLLGTEDGYVAGGLADGYIAKKQQLAGFK